LRGRAPRMMPPPGPRVRCTREDGILTITLAHPSRRNAIDACMRDELVEYLAFACDDPTLTAVHLRADGTDFSAGGDLAEFGVATDLVLAHAIRTLRSPARLMHSLAARATAFLHGACVGAGIEIPAAAGRVVAAADARFWLPELEMGLMPGAGGTVTIARRIGRRRMLFWALTGLRLDARTALSWRLVDEVRGHGEAQGSG
jgi:enoyl-CoA hydratase/carnithine racemase